MTFDEIHDRLRLAAFAILEEADEDGKAEVMEQISIAMITLGGHALVAVRGSDEAADAFFDLAMITDEIAADLKVSDGGSDQEGTVH